MGRTKYRRTLASLAAALLAAHTGYADLIAVVSDPTLRPAMSEWTRYRTAQGHRVVMLGLNDLRSRLPTLKGDTAAGERLVVLLVGDGERSGPRPVSTPARVVSRYGPEPDIATDLPYARLAGADAVGRLPFSDAASLRAYLQRVIAREQTPADWGEARLQIAAGVGGFSPLIDAAIEGAAANLVTALAPPTASMSLRRFDPSGTGPEEPGPNGTQRGGVWVWMGHGLRGLLPGVADHQLERVTNGADVACLLACYAGDFAAPGRCVAERMLGSAEGPLVVIAATRVSMPYGNARLGAELLSGWRESPSEPVGVLFQSAQRRSGVEASVDAIARLDQLATLLGAPTASLEAERLDHIDLYQLLGDPCVAFDRSRPLTIEHPTTVQATDDLVVRGVAPAGGALRAELFNPNVRAGAPAGDFATVELRVESGEEFAVRLPPDPRWRSGVRRLRVGIVGEAGLAFAVGDVRRVGNSPARVAGNDAASTAR